MSTRSQVIIKDSYSEQWFYRHCDGYPEGIMPSLQKFIGWVRTGAIRDNVEQSCGWLVVLGAKEYDTPREPDTLGHLSGWKVGAYEPCEKERHGDIEFIYVIDLGDKSIKGYSVKFDDSDGKEDELVCSDSADNPWKES